MARYLGGLGTGQDIGTSLALARPAEAVVGCVLAIGVYLESVSAVFSDPAGAVAVANPVEDSSQLCAWLKVDDGTDPINVTWGGVSAYRDGWIGAYADVIATGARASSRANPVASTSLTCSSVTTPADNSTVVMLAAANGNPGTITPPGGYTERARRAGMYSADLLNFGARGTTGALVATMTNSVQSLGVLVALAPTPAPVMPMAYVAGFARQSDGTLSMTTDLTNATWQAGFLRSPAGALVVSVLAPTRTFGGHWRDDNGALSIALDTAGSWDQGFLRSTTGALCVTSTGPFTDQAGFQRDAAGRLAVTIG